MLCFVVVVVVVVAVVVVVVLGVGVEGLETVIMFAQESTFKSP